jgi:hypothetical protein
MQNFLSTLNWGWLGILAVIWLLIDFAWVGRFNDLIKRIGKIFSSPWVFAKDPEPYGHPLYPRTFLEQLAQRDLPTQRNDGGASDSISKWWKSLGDSVLGNESPLVTIGHVLSLIFFLFFIYADAVTVANTLVLIGVEGNLPVILQRLDLAILGGALISATVGVWIFLEMLSKKGEFIAVEKLGGAQKFTYGFISIMVILFSIAVMLALAGQRMISLGIYQTTPTLDFQISFSLYGLLAINSALAAAITFTSGANGVIVLLILLGAVVTLVMPILVFIFDLILRVVIIVLDVVAWLLFTPFMAIPAGINRLFRSSRSNG